MNLTEFYAWLEASDGTLMDSDMVSYTAEDYNDPENITVTITDMDDELPSEHFTITVDDTIIDNGNHIIVIDAYSTEWIFKRLVCVSEGEVLDCSVLEDYLDKKEAIAGILFEDNELSESYIAPSEDHCHQLADLILKRLGLV